jgi:hypothetical protein
MPNRNDSYLTRIHRLRQVKGALRQAHHKTTLGHLQQTLSNDIKESHPYRLSFDKTLNINQMEPLFSVLGFLPGARGTDVIPHDDYLYHLSSISKVKKEKFWTWLPPVCGTLRAADRKLFSCLKQKYDVECGGTGWMPLKDFASGEYKRRDDRDVRNFTWWTNQKLLDAHIVCAAHRLGLPNTWIPKYALIMRCRASEVGARLLSHVPSVIDAFVSEIFHPADYRTAIPTCGHTINLDSPGQLQTGAKEYALNPIAVELIEFFPIEIGWSKRSPHVVSRNVGLWQLLESYYDNNL